MMYTIHVVVDKEVQVLFINYIYIMYMYII